MNTRLLTNALVMVTAAATTSIAAADARTIQAPVPFADDRSTLFDRGERIDLGDPGDVFHMEIIGDSVQAALDVVLDAGRDGEPGYRVEAEFPADDTSEHLVLELQDADRVQLHDLAEGVGVWIKADPMTFMAFTFRDASGHEFDIPIHHQASHDWEYVGASLGNIHRPRLPHENLEFPVVWTGLSLDVGRSGRQGQMQATLSGFERVQRLELEQQITIELEDAPFAHIYEPGDAMVARFSAPEGTIRWRLQDYDKQVLADGESQGEVTVAYDLEKPGYYEIIVDLIDAEGRRLDTRRLSMGAMRPTDTVHHALGFSGTHFNRHYYDFDAMDLLPIIGVNRIRMGLPWQAIETAPGELELPSRIATTIEVARERGLRDLGVWLGNAGAYGQGAPLTDEEREAFTRYAIYTAEQSEGVIDQFEIWNEWTHGTGLPDEEARTPEGYKKLVATAVPPFRERFPDIHLIGLGGENPYRFEEEIEGMLRAGAGEYVDSISLHPYRMPYGPEEVHRPGADPLDKTMSRFSEMSREYGGPETIQITEIGLSTHQMSWGVTTREHARFLVRTLALLGASEHVDGIWWYTLRSAPEIPLGSFTTSENFPQHHFGVFESPHHAYAPKPAAIAMGVYARMTANKQLGPVNRLNPHTYEIPIRHEDESRLGSILWTTARTQSVEVSGGDLQLVDIVGHRQALEQSTLELTGDPVYVLDENLEVRLVAE